MDFNLSEEQRQLRDGAARFLREQYPFDKRRQLAAGAGFSAEAWGRYAELGWLALGLPEEVGGLGCSFIETALLAEEFGRGMVLEPYIPCAVLCARLLERSTGFAARNGLLEALAEGRLMLALAHAEPGERYAAEARRTQARPTATGWSLEGRKTLVAGAPIADQLLVTACIEGETALFLVPARADGVTVQDYALIDGTRAGDVHLGEAAVPRENLLARGSAATTLLEEALDRANLALCADALGCLEAAMAATSDYIKTRQQFGQPIGRFQALQHRMAEMFVEAQEARSALYRGLAAIDAGDAVARMTAVSAARVAVSAAARFVTEQGIQLHGGIGMTDEYQVGHYYKRVIVATKLFGDDDWHLDRYVGLRRQEA